MSSPILVAGLDSRSLLLEAPFLLRGRRPDRGAASACDLMERLARGGRGSSCSGPRSRTRPSSRSSAGSAACPPPARSRSSRSSPRGSRHASRRRPRGRRQRRPAPAPRPRPSRGLARQAARRCPAASTRGSRCRARWWAPPGTRSSGHFYGLSRNLSVNGMLLASPVRLAGSDLDIEFHLPESGRRVRAIGRVVREARDVAWPYLGYGVEFVFVPAGQPGRAGRARDRHLPAPPAARRRPSRAGGAHRGHGPPRRLDLRDRGARALRRRLPGRDPPRAARGLAPRARRDPTSSWRQSRPTRR